MVLSWTQQNDGAYTATASGYTLSVEYSDTAWLWRVATPDGDTDGGAEDSLESAQTEAERAARRHAIDLVNRLIATRYDRGALTAEEQVLRGQALGFLGDSVTWAAYLGDSLLGTGSTEEEAIESAVRQYEYAVGFGDNPYQCQTREELVWRLTLCLLDEDE